MRADDVEIELDFVLLAVVTPPTPGATSAPSSAPGLPIGFRVRSENKFKLRCSASSGTSGQACCSVPAVWNASHGVFEQVRISSLTSVSVSVQVADIGGGGGGGF